MISQKRGRFGSSGEFSSGRGSDWRRLYEVYLRPSPRSMNFEFYIIDFLPRALGIMRHLLSCARMVVPEVARNRFGLICSARADGLVGCAAVGPESLEEEPGAGDHTEC